MATEEPRVTSKFCYEFAMGQHFAPLLQQCKQGGISKLAPRYTRFAISGCLDSPKAEHSIHVKLDMPIQMCIQLSIDLEPSTHSLTHYI